MRFIFGLIIGIALTIGAAYIHDSNIAVAPAVAEPGQAVPNTGAGRIVNWDVVNTITRAQMAFVREQWNKIFQ